MGLEGHLVHEGLDGAAADERSRAGLDVVCRSEHDRGVASDVECLTNLVISLLQGDMERS
jgi:hypothetical protein